MRPLFALAFMSLCACVGDSYLDDHADDLLGGAEIAQSLDSLWHGKTDRPVVSRIDDGMWIYSRAIHPRYDVDGWAFWVDVAVENLAFHKDVRITWTSDNWQSVNIVNAHYKDSYRDGFERWGVDVYIPKSRDYYSTKGVFYSIAVVMNGVEYACPGNNHILGWPENTNVRYVGGQVESEGGNAWFSGAVTVRNLALEKQVDIIYTTDDWQTVVWTPAAYRAGNEWDFSIDLPGSEPRVLEFAIRYSAGGQVYWDNRHGFNYQFQIGPDLSLSQPQEEHLEGVYAFSFSDRNINRREAFELYVNGGLVASDLLTYARVFVSTFDFMPAETLQMELYARDEHGFEQSLVHDFTVSMNVEPLFTFAEDIVAWPYVSVIRDEKLWTSDMNLPIVHSYDLSSGEEKSLEIEHRSRGIDLLSDGRLVLLERDRNYISIYNQDGELQHRFDIDESILRIPVHLVTWPDDEIMVTSYVDKAAARFSSDGQYLGSISLPAAFRSFRRYNDELWVAGTYPQVFITRLDRQGRVLGSIDLTGIDSIGHFNDIAVSDDYIITKGNNNFTVFDGSGEYLFGWTGMSEQGEERRPGHFGSIISSVNIHQDMVYISDYGFSRIHALRILQ